MAGRVVATDVDAVAVARMLPNAGRNEPDRAEGRVGSLFAPVRCERLDVIVTFLPQPPSPARIIPTRYGRRDGLIFLRRLARGAPRAIPCPAAASTP